MSHDSPLLLPLVRQIGAAESADRDLDLITIAAELGASISSITLAIEELEQLGLAWTEPERPSRPMLTRAGHQYDDRDGDVDLHALAFLASAIDDLHAREALLRAGTTLVRQFHEAFTAGLEIEHARALIPAAFEQAVTKSIALDLYAAAVALIARLSAGEPAGCVAEEIIAVDLISDANDWLDSRQHEGTIDEDDVAEAGAALHGLFDLFGDDDVLALFEMHEPGDAALAGHTARNIEMGVVDQRVEAWFRPFDATPPTGHLDVRTIDPDA